MYDQERMLEVARMQAVTSGSAAVECLLDFSKGPGAMQMIATMGAPTYLVPKIADDERYVKVEEGRKSTTAPSSTPIDSHSMSPTPRSPDSTTSPIDAHAVKPRAICSFCGKSFAHLGDHNKHRRRHTGERPYGCDLCPLRFAHASNLARHRRLHSGEKPFGCGGCGKRFSRKDKLAMHVARRCCEKTRHTK